MADRPAPDEPAVPQLLHEFFERQASARPDQIAVVTPGRIITYVQVEESANRLARCLRARGVGPGSLVGLLLPRSANVYIGLLAILKAGGAYVPIDPDYPADRVSYILTDCKATALVTVNELAAKAEFPGASILLDKAADEIAAQSAERLARAEVKVATTDLSYIIYTSGSTGKPKGVEIEHRSACNLVQVERGLYGVRPDDRVFQGFSIAFDASVEEVWMAFAGGATLVVGTSEMMHAGPALAQILTEARITAFSTVPTLLSMLDDDIPSLRILILGGETCPPDLVQRWARPGVRRMFNTYGPTEATVICTAWECVPNQPVTIGPPIPTYTILLLDESLQPVPPGKPGEVYIGGIGVARGYVGRPDLTAERFIANPIPGGPPRLYRTGDLGRWTAKGEIEYLGRADSQVKIRGFRVELSEIEAVLLECPGVKAAAVNVHQDPGGIQQLIGYVVTRDGTAPDEDAIRTVLRSRLPPYMMPALLETLDNLPTLPSGKVDRKSLPAPRPREAKTGKGQRPEPRSDLEKQIAAVWTRLFAPQPVSIRDDFFFDLGGHSLLAARMVSELRKRPGLGDVAVLDLYKHTTIEALAAHVEKRQRDAAARLINPEPLAPEAAGPSQFHPVSPRVHRLCGLAQLVALYFILGFASLQFLIPYLVYTWATAANYPLGITLIYSALGAVAAYPLMVLLSVVIKWIVIGRFQPGFYPLWGLYYFRWWFVKSIVAVVPRNFLAGTPLINLYFRLMGAEIGKDVYIGTDEALAFDLLHIGDGSHVGVETGLGGCVVEDGLLKIGHIDIGKNCFVGSRCMLRPGAILAEGACLDDLSLLRTDSRVRAGKRSSGSPAVPAGNYAVHREHEVIHHGLGRRFLFGLCAAAGVLLFPLTVLTAIIPGLYLFEAVNLWLGGYWFLVFAPVVALIFVILFCIEVALLKWLLVGKVKAGRYSLYGWFHLRKWFVDNLLDLVLNILLPIHASIYEVPWYRLLGAKVGKRAELSTAVYVTPDLVTVGEGSFVADNAALGPARVEGGCMNLGEVRIGTKTFIGNSALLPAGSSVANGCLVGVLSTTPTDAWDAAKPGLTWLGSPAFSLPQRQQSTAFPQSRTFNPTRKLLMQRGLVEAVRVVLPLTCVLVLTSLFLISTVAIHQAASLWAAILTLPLLLAAAGVAGCLVAIAVKWLVVGRYKPREAPLWSPFVWATELVSNVCEWLGDVYLVRNLLGTPHVCWFFRLLGTKIGKRVYMDTAELTEYDLIEIGDDVALGETCTIQTHLFEDRVMKMSHIRIGNRCSVGAGSTVLYDTFMADGSSLEDLSLLMKGEVLPAGTAWTGIPAIPATKTPERDVLSTMARAISQNEPMRTQAKEARQWDAPARNL